MDQKTNQALMRVMTEKPKSCVEQQKQQHLVSLSKQLGPAQQFLVTYNPSVQLKTETSLERVFYGQAPSLANIVNVYNYDILETWFMAQLEDLNDFVGAKEKITIEKMALCARMIFTNYPYLKASEILLFFFRLKSGRYGTFYGSVDPQKINISLIEFCKERVFEMRKIERDQKEIQLQKDREEWAKTAVSREEYERMKLST